MKEKYLLVWLKYHNDPIKIKEEDFPKYKGKIWSYSDIREYCKYYPENTKICGGIK